ncbi:MAG: hypothetical protein KatS3mg104_1718 [Phycisphaerae bacterium]|jgi:AraC-like DNA-binding protein|nr:MAG: hypothetical protein KatS3mg104_1718 [Phycisphaerae bacterium]
MFQRLQIDKKLLGEIWEYGPPQRSTEAHRHSELEVNLVISGTATYVLRDRRYELGTGTLVWLFPAQEHLIVRQSSNFRMWIGVFRQTMLRNTELGQARILRQKSPTEIFCRSLSPTTTTELAYLFQKVQSARNYPPEFNSGLKYLLLSGWSAFERSAKVLPQQMLHPVVAQVIHSAELLDSNIRIDHLAAGAGISVGQLSRLFRQQMGIRLVDYRNHRRLQQFLSLYRRGTMTALSAALQSGFGSYPQFHRVFRAQIGESVRSFSRKLKSMR